MGWIKTACKKVCRRIRRLRGGSAPARRKELARRRVELARHLDQVRRDSAAVDRAQESYERTLQSMERGYKGELGREK